MRSDALSASGPPQAAVKTFREWSSQQKDSGTAWQLKVELAGLSVVAGNAEPANALIQEIEGAGNQDWAPVAMGRLGWWYYRAGDAAKAASLLGRVVERLPSRSIYQCELGWALIEQRNFESAITRFSNASGTSADSSMGLAVAYWLGGDKDKAVSFYAAAVADHPEWLNARWVAALYSPHAAESVAAIRVEQEKRLAAYQTRQGR